MVLFTRHFERDELKELESVRFALIPIWTQFVYMLEMLAYQNGFNNATDSRFSFEVMIKL